MFIMFIIIDLHVNNTYDDKDYDSNVDTDNRKDDVISNRKPEEDDSDVTIIYCRHH